MKVQRQNRWLGRFLSRVSGAAFKQLSPPGLLSSSEQFNLIFQGVDSLGGCPKLSSQL
jgi:hypothetical protein